MSLNDEELRSLDLFAMEEAGRAFDGVPPKPNRWAHRALGVVLAGGQARRMNGLDKPLLPLAGTRLIDRAIAQLAPQVGQMIISGNGDLARFETDVPVLADGLGEYAGPLAGILTAMRWAQANAPHCFYVISVAADTPFFPPDLVDRFVMAMGGPEPSIVLAQSGEHIHPTFGLWPVVLADDLEAFLADGGRKVRQWAGQNPCSHASFTGMMIDGLEIDPFFNINEPDDIEVAEAIADGLADLQEESGTAKDAR